MQLDYPRISTLVLCNRTDRENKTNWGKVKKVWKNTCRAVSGSQIHIVGDNNGIFYLCHATQSNKRWAMGADYAVVFQIATFMGNMHAIKMPLFKSITSNILWLWMQEVTRALPLSQTSALSILSCFNGSCFNGRPLLKNYNYFSVTSIKWCYLATVTRRAQ